MAKSIFDKMENIQEVNRMAAELRRLGMREKLKELADKNRVMDEDFEAFFLGKRYFLVDAGETQKTYDTARAKIMDEMLTLNEPLFGNVIGSYLLQCCSEPGFQESVLQEHKTLQRCLEYVMEQAYGLLDENQKKARRNTAVAVVSDQVFEWVKNYYTLDDKAALEEKRKKAEKEFADRNKPKENKAAGKGTSKKKAAKTSKASKTSKTSKKSSEAGISGKAGASGNAADSEKSLAEKREIGDMLSENIQAEDLPETEPNTSEKGQIEGQVSMFSMGAAA
ncbi:Cas9 inhibitor AcrIIA9 family protein [Sporofaciens musculi]|uniref:Cas9 inhibitor AcrIIA9 family protein n=1 Tax=Sporofaciens musculi TaxID=2681861 RepID=UPI00259C97B2|nr:Cas9 inhibitor AcrIIA9 family protein [Sporofaciens musculi]